MSADIIFCGNTITAGHSIVLGGRGRVDGWVG